jgi:hypothetical protein
LDGREAIEVAIVRVHDATVFERRRSEVRAEMTGSAAHSGSMQPNDGKAVAITYSRFGGPDVLMLSEVEIPQPESGQTRIRVRAFTGADPADRAPEALAELVNLAAAGKLSVVLWRSYALAQAADAHADIEAGANHGKIVLIP